jgi:hypothetical protein
LLGQRAYDSEWERSGVECVGNAADKLHELSDARARVPGEALLQIAASVTQVIDGRFVGYQQYRNQPWIIIRAVDSSFYEIEIEDEEVLTQIREHFTNVEDYSLER